MEKMKKNDGHLLRGCSWLGVTNGQITGPLWIIYIQCKLILWLTAVVWVRISPSALRIWISDKPPQLGGEYQGFRGQCRNPMNDKNPLDLFYSSL